jgi:aquaporin Z
MLFAMPFAMSRLLTEFVGTFFLLAIIILASQHAPTYAPLVIGVGLFTLVAMGANTSGAHYNPAVSLSMLTLGKLNLRDVAGYVAAQFLGAACAWFTCRLLLANAWMPTSAPSVSNAQAVFVEIIFTALLVLVVLNTALHPKSPGLVLAAPSIGLAVAAGAAAGGPISGGAFNPAVGVMPTLLAALIEGKDAQGMWLYVVGPCAGALLATAIYAVQTREFSK